MFLFFVNPTLLMHEREGWRAFQTITIPAANWKAFFSFKPQPPLAEVEESVIPIPRTVAFNVTFQHPYRDPNSGC